MIVCFLALIISILYIINRLFFCCLDSILSHILFSFQINICFLSGVR